MSYTTEDIKSIIKDCIIEGDATINFNNIKPINEANEFSLVWISSRKPDRQELVANTAAKIIICDKELFIKEEWKATKCFIVVENPRLHFIKVVAALFETKMKPFIHPNAQIHKDAKLGSNLYIGPNAVIGKCTIGDNTVIYGNCFIHDGVTIGIQCVINAGAVIGSSGFGYERWGNEVIAFPHTGSVRIGNYVDIGANTCIDRGTIGDTVISDSVKIDNLVHIAHNVFIGKRSFIIAHAMIGGSTHIGEDVWVAPNASLRDGLTIADNVTVGLSAVVTKSIPKDEIWIGNPAKKLSK